jgi:hypothetical protein
MICEPQNHCGLSFCRVLRKRYVYGLYDRRTETVFYVGSTFSLARRFSDHMREHPYVQRMIERGEFPIPLLLLEFETQCDLYSRSVERDIARQLQEQGHSAYGDGTVSSYYSHPWFYHLVEEQAYQFSVLCEMWNRG